MSNSFIYCPSVNGLLCLAIYWSATKLAEVLEFVDFTHLFKALLLWSAFQSSFETALFLSSPAGYISAKAFLVWKCLSTLDFLLFANFSPHIKHTGKPASSAVKANESVHEALNVLFSSETFLFFGFIHGSLPGPKIQNKSVAWWQQMSHARCERQNIETPFNLMLQDRLNLKNSNYYIEKTKYIT